MNLFFVHHAKCPKCHGTGSYLEGSHDIERKAWVGNYVFNCNCFEHMKAERAQKDTALQTWVAENGF